MFNPSAVFSWFKKLRYKQVKYQNLLLISTRHQRCTKTAIHDIVSVIISIISMLKSPQMALSRTGTALPYIFSHIFIQWTSLTVKNNQNILDARVGWLSRIWECKLQVSVWAETFMQAGSSSSRELIHDCTSVSFSNQSCEDIHDYPLDGNSQRST